MATRRQKGKRARATRKPRAPRTREAQAPRGQIGPQTYEAVRKIVEEKKIPVGKAFEEVAKATGRQPGTVAVTYYRIARKNAGPAHKAGARRGPGRKTGARGGRADLRSGGVLARVAEALRELEEIIAQQAEEIARLRGESRLAERIRRALRD